MSRFRHRNIIVLLMIYIVSIVILYAVLSANQTLTAKEATVPSISVSQDSYSHILPTKNTNRTFTDNLIIEEREDFKIKIDEVLEDVEKVRITLIDIRTGREVKISDPLSLWASTIIYTNPDRNFVWLSSGSYVIRTSELISLETGMLVMPAFASTAPHFFENYVIYNVYHNERLYSEMTPDIVLLDLNTLKSKILYKSDVLNGYMLGDIEDGKLTIYHYSVEKESDWNTDNRMEQKEIYTL